MQVNLRDYQTQCLDSIEDKVKNRAQHLSVIIPVGMGGGFLAMALAERLESDYENRVGVVFRYTKDLLMWKSENRFLVNKDNFLSFVTWERSNKDFKYLIFLADLPRYERLVASKKLSGKDSVTFFSPRPYHLLYLKEKSFMAIALALLHMILLAFSLRTKRWTCMMLNILTNQKSLL